MNKEQLADFIEQNPNCMIDIDNDAWFIYEPAYDDIESKDITDSTKFSFNSNWYGHSSNYGFGVADALVVLLNRRGFNLKVQAV